MDFTFHCANRSVILKKGLESPSGSTTNTYHILEWVNYNNLSYSRMAQPHHLIITPKLMSLDIGHLLNDMFNINGKRIPKASSHMQLKLLENLPHSTEHVSS